MKQPRESVCVELDKEKIGENLKKNAVLRGRQTEEAQEEVIHN